MEEFLTQITLFVSEYANVLLGIVIVVLTLGIMSFLSAIRDTEFGRQVQQALDMIERVAPRLIDVAADLNEEDMAKYAELGSQYEELADDDPRHIYVLAKLDKFLEVNFPQVDIDTLQVSNLVQSIYKNMQ